MALSVYHQKYASRSDEEIQRRLQVKEDELRIIFERMPFAIKSEVVKIAVLGCADQRMVKAHADIFTRILTKPVTIITFDITIEHLQGEEGVVKYDCTLPLPNAPYDITFAHVLLKFIETKKQWDVLKNSYEALASGGIAIHVLDKEDYGIPSLKLPDGYFSVSLQRWKERLDKEGIKYQTIPVKYGLALVLLHP